MKRTKNTNTSRTFDQFTMTLFVWNLIRSQWPDSVILKLGSPPDIIEKFIAHCQREEAAFVPLSQEIHKPKAICNIQLDFKRLWNLMPSLQALSLTKQSNNFPTPSFPRTLLNFLAKVRAAFLPIAGSLNDNVLRLLRQNFQTATRKFSFIIVQTLVPITLDKVLRPSKL